MFQEINLMVAGTTLPRHRSTSLLRGLRVVRTIAVAAGRDTCEICGTKPSGALCVDHCHATGKARGLLCNHCNQRVGFIERGKACVMPSAIWAALQEYLAKHGAES